MISKRLYDDELVAEIERKRDKTGRELQKIGNGKKLVVAYR
jgi:hypothetical protein